MIHVTQFESLPALNAACIARMRTTLQAESATPSALMLSGGRTPLSIFNEIAANPFPVAANVYLTYTDDRDVLEDSPESNYGTTLPMIHALGLPLERVLRVPTELPLEAAAERWHQDFEAFFAQGGQIPLAFLGMGADGHTCSLFSQDDLDRGAGRFASPTWRPSPPNRVTVTPTLLERCDEVIFLVTGADKADVIAQLLGDPTSIPAGRAVAQCGNVQLWRA